MRWNGKIIPGIISVSGLVRKTEVIINRVGGTTATPRRSPGVTAYEPIVIIRAKSSNLEFEKWANKVYRFESGQTMLKDFRKDILIEMYNLAGNKVMVFMVLGY